MNILHESTYFTMRQCDLKRCFVFETAHKSVKLTFCQLLALRNKVNAINLCAHFNEEEHECGIEILLFKNREHVLILDTYQVIALKKFMEDTFSILECAPLAHLSI